MHYGLTALVSHCWVQVPPRCGTPAISTAYLPAVYCQYAGKLQQQRTAWHWHHDPLKARGHVPDESALHPRMSQRKLSIFGDTAIENWRRRDPRSPGASPKISSFCHFVADLCNHFRKVYSRSRVLCVVFKLRTS